MSPGLRQHKSAECRIAIAEGIPEEMRADVREILALKSTNPRKGHATELMWTVCAEADREWITLIVQPRKFADGMDDAKLIPFYKNFDFVVIQTEPCVLMARQPEAPRIVRVH